MKKTRLKVEEALASAVEKYPCLYRGQIQGTKRRQNAWVEIENTLELERGKAYFAT